MTRVSDVTRYKPDIKIHTVCFLLGYAIFLITLILSSNIEIVQMQEAGVDIIGKVMKLVRYLAYALLLAGVADKFVERRKILAVIFVSVFLALEVLFSRNTTMLLYIFLFVGAAVVDAKTIVKTSFLTKGILLFLTVVLSRIGVIQDYVFLDGDRYRHGLGFSWTTTGSILFLHVCLEYIYLRREKITLIEYAILELLNIWFYKMTDASMAFYLTGAFLVFFAVVRLERKKFFLLSKIRNVALLAPVLCAGLTIWAQYAYDFKNPVWYRLNEFVHGRLQLGHDAIKNYGITLLGQKMEWIGFSIRQMKGAYNYVDCSYLQLCIEYGLIFLLLVLLLYTFLIYRGLKNNDMYLVCVLGFLLIFAMTEPRLMNLMYTTFPLLVFAKMEGEGLRLPSFEKRKLTYGEAA